MKKLFWLTLVWAPSLFAEGTAAAGNGKTMFFTYLAALAIIGMAITGVGVAIAQSRAAVKALEGVARQPEAAGKLMTQMLIALVFMETLAIYALLVVFLLLYVNPFIKYL